MSIQTIISVIQTVVAAALIASVVSQSSKADAMGGLMSGGGPKTEGSAFKGKKGSEERLAELTQKMAITFLVVSFAAAYFF